MKNRPKSALVLTPLLLGLAMVVRQDDHPEHDMSSLTVEEEQALMMQTMAVMGPGEDPVMRGTDYDAIAQYTQVYDFVMTFIDDDTWRFEIIFHDGLHAPAGEPFKMVEVLNTRIED